MKLYLMKREALETLKANLSTVYARYYTEPTNKWILDLCGEDAFIEFKDIPEFKLADLNTGMSKGEIDLSNCKIIYEKLNFLSESQASDERLWAGLAHSTFYSYMRQRWGYGYGKKPKHAEKEAGEIKTRFFYSSGIRSGFYRNTLAKCWWVGRNTYDGSNVQNYFERLDIIGSNDINSKITEIFYNFTFSSNPFVLGGIIDALNYFKKEGIALNVKEHIRPAMSYLNAVGGSVVIDCLRQEAITEILVDAIQGIKQGDTFAISVEEDDYSFVGMEEELEDAKKVSEEANDMEVVLGCKVQVRYSDGETKTYLYDYINGTIPKLIYGLEGHRVGDIVQIGVREGVVDYITL